MKRVSSDAPFFAALWAIGGVYLLLVLAMLVADASYTTPTKLVAAMADPAVRAAALLTLASVSIATILGLLVATPLAYLMSRQRFTGRAVIDAVLDIPNVLPPLVLGLSLLILFQCWPMSLLAPWVVYQPPAVVLAQFVVATAFAFRALRGVFDQVDSRCEDVALTLGCSRRQAFFRVTLPQVRRGLGAAAALAWARCLGEFGPLWVFAGTTRFKTEVLSTTIYLELSSGDLEAAVAVSLLLVLVAVSILIAARLLGGRAAVA